MIQTKVVAKIKTQILYSGPFLRKSRRLWDVEKCSGVKGATNDVTTWRIRVACWIRKATGTQAHKYVIFIDFLGNNDSRTGLNATLHVHRPSCCPYTHVCCDTIIQQFTRKQILPHMTSFLLSLLIHPKHLQIRLPSERYNKRGYLVQQLVDTLRNKQQGRGCDSRWAPWDFHWPIIPAALWPRDRLSL